MLYAIGKPGEPVRIFVRSRREDDAARQRLDGEVHLDAETDAPAMISADGSELVTPA